MNILFLTIGRFGSLKSHSIYTDLLRKLKETGNNIYLINSVERREKLPTTYSKSEEGNFLQVKTGNITRTNIVEKGISTILIANEYKKAINKYLCDVKFDLILYTTPPITLCSVVEYIKKRDNCATYLMLKDIFPQNAVDMGMFSKSGIKGLFYKYFRTKEKKLYALSDYIGCMSQANVDFVIKHNPQIDKNIVEICPNAFDTIDMSASTEEKNNIRKKYNIPTDKKVLIYGGNLGKPQGIPFLLKCLESQKKNEDVYFVIVGDGCDYHLISEYVKSNKQNNVMLLSRVVPEKYDELVSACDIGLIFLDYKFTIPNFPSRLLNYLQAKLPVITCTDRVCDMGIIAEENNFGFRAFSNDVSSFDEKLKLALSSDLVKMGENGFLYMKNNYDTDNCYRIIMKHF